MKYGFLGTAAIAALPLAGCVSTSNVIDTGSGNYSVSSTADGFRTSSSARQYAFEAGEQKCQDQGKKLQLVQEETYPTRMGIDSTVTIRFRCS